MAHYRKALNIWTLSAAERAQLQPGQRIFAGTPDNAGTFLGEHAGGTVAMWDGNAKGRDRLAYLRQLRAYAKSCHPLATTTEGDTTQ